MSATVQRAGGALPRCAASPRCEASWTASAQRRERSESAGIPGAPGLPPALPQLRRPWVLLSSSPPANSTWHTVYTEPAAIQGHFSKTGGDQFLSNSRKHTWKVTQNEKTDEHLSNEGKGKMPRKKPQGNRNKPSS